MFRCSIARLAKRGLNLLVLLIPLTLTFLAVVRHFRHLNMVSVSQTGQVHSLSLNNEHMVPVVGNVHFKGNWGIVTSSIPSPSTVLPVRGIDLVSKEGIVYWQPPSSGLFSDTVKSERPKVILMKYFPPTLIAKTGADALQRCPQHSSLACSVTQDPDVNADLVIVYSHNSDSWGNTSPPLKPPGQIWVFYATISPLHTHKRIMERRKWTQLFNWTMTYLRESDIPLTTFGLVRLYSNSSRAVRHSPEGKHMEMQEQNVKRSPGLDQRAQSVISAHDAKLSQVMATKTIMAAVILNDCDDRAQRLIFVQLLANISSDHVHVYGKCGKFSCPKTIEECYKFLEQKYFFLLSFENALCQDYVSEVHHILSNYYIVPVVRGGANYAKLTPPKSVIDTSKFHAIIDLHRYLDYLRLHIDEYVRYLSWKTEFALVLPQPFPWCQICAMLQEVNEGKRRHQAYENVFKWWRDGRCFQPNDLSIWGQF